MYACLICEQGFYREVGVAVFAAHMYYMHGIRSENYRKHPPNPHVAEPLKHIATVGSGQPMDLDKGKIAVFSAGEPVKIQCKATWYNARVIKWTSYYSHVQYYNGQHAFVKSYRLRNPTQIGKRKSAHRLKHSEDEDSRCSSPGPASEQSSGYSNTKKASTTVCESAALEIATQDNLVTSTALESCVNGTLNDSTVSGDVSNSSDESVILLNH